MTGCAPGAGGTDFSLCSARRALPLPNPDRLLHLPACSRVAVQWSRDRQEAEKRSNGLGQLTDAPPSRDQRRGQPMGEGAAFLLRIANRGASGRRQLPRQSSKRPGKTNSERDDAGNENAGHRHANGNRADADDLPRHAYHDDRCRCQQDQQKDRRSEASQDAFNVDHPAQQNNSNRGPLPCARSYIKNGSRDYRRRF